MSRRPPQQGRGRNADRARSSRLPESVGTLTIDRIAAGGDGVGRLDGLAVFVPRTAAGDVVQAAYVTHARHARGRVLQVLTPSTDRVTPPCVHYERDRCGGCQLQHLAIEAQREARRHIVKDTLSRIGKREVPLPELIAGVAWEYRSRLTLTLLRRSSGWVGGLHPHDDPVRVFALEECHIAHPTLVSVWHALRALIRSTDVLLPAVETLRLAIRLDSADDSVRATGAEGADAAPPTVALVIEGGTVWPDQDAWTAAALKADARIGAVWWTPERAQERADARGNAPADAAAVEYAPQAREALAFAQVNPVVAMALREYVYAAVQGFSPSTVIDAYAGTGPLAARLFADGVSVVAIESDRAGAEAATVRLQTASGGSAQARVMCDVVERALPTLSRASVPADVVVLNPPRRGVHVGVTHWLEAEAQRELRGVVYVSCDPATLARDLARLPSWHVRAVQCFDMFPQTAHVETVCVLHRETT
ncbi:class I SAM-dependent RNA methyltransferase [Gemmatimonas sp.]|uniref:class I SAM-dependent RNA methyltransferase n=1 Tax=Gemmatimonas sp. TaxID=1962908 RepID=UPI0037BF6E10